MATRQDRAVSELVRDLTNFGQLVSKAQRQALTKGLLALRNAELAKAKELSGGNLVLSGVGVNGAKVGARERVLKDNFGIVRATGPWQIRDSSVSGGPVKPHVITSKYGGSTRRGRGKKLHYPVGGIGPITGRGSGVGGAINIFGETRKDSKGWRMYARHPGAPRRNYWVQGINTVFPTLGRLIHDRWVKQAGDAVF